jgi:hypothetical protein
MSAGKAIAVTAYPVLISALVPSCEYAYRLHRGAAICTLRQLNSLSGWRLPVSLAGWRRAGIDAPLYQTHMDAYPAPIDNPAVEVYTF